uniref:CD276 antigen homolog isoform X1 n=2 Tax=Myxine glutinosa TaxID=7769 RepID=UPI00358F6BFC
MYHRTVNVERMKNLQLVKMLSMLFIFIHRCRGFKLETSKDPLTVQLGGTVVIPCFVKTRGNINPKNMKIYWSHFDGTVLSPVHYYYKGANIMEIQKPRYNNRTSLPDESKIRIGNISLILTAVRRHDEGQYKCEVDLSEESKEERVDVRVSVPLSSHKINLVTETSGSLVLICEAQGGDDITLSWEIGNQTVLSTRENKTTFDGQTHLATQIELKSPQPGEVVKCKAMNKERVISYVVPCEPFEHVVAKLYNHSRGFIILILRTTSLSTT